ncbi:hypothetical protein [Xenorhabdus sp. BG5]|uniref:hypothetical protein n=1 Tax=Xenorhabdus sp. BG5 TaxID=2782014 RepID=UPI001881D14E|nr:hypothetical protein [Xenorhabdus sp. BG5]MBE8596278.1 hypothetical protein [Xenorhabdus sp. BG5]
MNRTNLYKVMLLILFTPIISYADSDIVLFPGVCVNNMKDQDILACKDVDGGHAWIGNDSYSLSSSSNGRIPYATDENGNVGDKDRNITQGIALGTSAMSLVGSTAVGDTAEAVSKFSIAIGAHARVDFDTPNAIAVGYQSNVNGNNSVALGSKSIVTRVSNNSVALGSNSVADKDNIVSIGSSGDHKDVDGDIKILRKLVNLDDGDISADSKEAINGSQLQTVQDTIEANKKDIESNKDLLDTTNLMTEENARNIIDIITRVSTLEKKCNP